MFNWLREFINDKRAQEGAAGNLVGLAIALSIGLVVIAYVAPVGLEAIYDMDFANWSFAGESEDVATTSLFKLLPLFFGLALVILILKIATPN